MDLTSTFDIPLYAAFLLMLTSTGPFHGPTVLYQCAGVSELPGPSISGLVENRAKDRFIGASRLLADDVTVPYLPGNTRSVAAVSPNAARVERVTRVQGQPCSPWCRSFATGRSSLIESRKVTHEECNLSHACY